MPDIKHRILIVDDEVAQMKALCDTLELHGYETMGFNNGQEALDVLQAAKFDLLLTDMMMPGMDGLSLLRAAQKLDPNLVGVVMTGHGSIDTAVEAMKAGALDYILKPFKVRVILPVLSRALTVRELRLRNAALEQRERQHTIELEAANEELDSFASSIAHDLSAPARHVAGYAQILMEAHAAELSPTTLEYVRNIIKAGDRMGALIADMLAFSRLARAEIKREPVDLGALVESVRIELGPETKGREIVWKVSELPIVQADESMLRQVVHNLLSNAIKYTRGRASAEIEINSQVDRMNRIVVSVRDNGAGFDMRDSDKLFGMFQRLHSSSEFEGTGIGLANVRRILQRHGGQSWATAEKGKGAKFYFALPGH